MLLFWSFEQLNIWLYEFYCIVNLSDIPVALETYWYLWNSLITMFLCIYYLYFLWFSSKSLFAIARYSLPYSLLASEKNTPLFVIACYLKPCFCSFKVFETSSKADHVVCNIEPAFISSSLLHTLLKMIYNVRTNIFFLEYAGELHIIALRRGKRPK